MFLVVATCIRIGFRMNVQTKGHSLTASTVLILDINRICRAGSTNYSPWAVVAYFCGVYELRMVFTTINGCKKENKEFATEIVCGLYSLKYLIRFADP